MSRQKVWKKILYEQQGYPDNYTDKNFLRDLKKNIGIEYVNVYDAAKGGAIILEEICVVVIFLLIYVYLYKEWAEPILVFVNSSLLTGCGYVIYCLKFNSGFNRLSHDLRTLLMYLVLGLLFSPVVYKLTDTISTDTIYSSSGLMLLVHLIFFDYGVSAALVSKCISLSAVMFASISLSSRLLSAFHAFVLITTAIECFVLFPLLRKKINKPFCVSFLSVFFIIIPILWMISFLSFILFVLALLIVNVICPLLFVYYQKYKDNIYGPWDEVVIRIAENINDLIY